VDDATTKRVGEIRVRVEAATFGPWSWFGTPKEPILATTTGGKVFVIKPHRSGLNGATFWWRGGAKGYPRMIKTEECAIKEREYRNDLERIDHPDAEFIAHSRTDIPFLLEQVDALEAELKAFRDEQLERCENGNCDSTDSIYHEGCDGMFCIHGYCQDCGSHLIPETVTEGAA